MKRNYLEWNVSSLKPEKNKFHFLVKAEEIGISDQLIEKDIECDIVLLKKGSEVTLTGSVGFFIILQCSRCLEEFTNHKKENLSAHFVKSETYVSKEKEKLLESDITIEYYHKDTIDLTQIIYDAVNLSIPLKPLCKEDCKGLCPICGTNLNKESCKCKREKTDPRWEPLKKLLKNNGRKK